MSWEKVLQHFVLILKLVEMTVLFCTYFWDKKKVLRHSILTFKLKESTPAFCSYFWVDRKYCGILYLLLSWKKVLRHSGWFNSSPRYVYTLKFRWQIICFLFPFFFAHHTFFRPFRPMCLFFFPFSFLLSSFFFFTSYLPSWKASQMDLKWSPLPGGGIRNFIQHSRNLPALLNKIFNVFLIRLRCYQHFNKIIDQFLSQSNQYLVSEGITNI